MWITKQSESGYTYWENAETREVSWVLPMEAVQAPAEGNRWERYQEPRGGPIYMSNAYTVQTAVVGESSTGEGWDRETDDAGQVYYVRSGSASAAVRDYQVYPSDDESSIASSTAEPASPASAHSGHSGGLLRGVLDNIKHAGSTVRGVSGSAIGTVRGLGGSALGTVKGAGLLTASAVVRFAQEAAGWLASESTMKAAAAVADRTEIVVDNFLQGLLDAALAFQGPSMPPTETEAILDEAITGDSYYAEPPLIGTDTDTVSPVEVDTGRVETRADSPAGNCNLTTVDAPATEDAPLAEASIFTSSSVAVELAAAAEMAAEAARASESLNTALSYNRGS